MKNQLKKIFTLLAIAGLLVPFVSLADTPAPRSFYGTVLFNGNPVEASLTVTAYCDSIESPISTAQGSTFVNEEDGSLYGTNTLPAPPINPNILQISNCPSDKVVYFTLNVGGNELIANENSTAQSLENNQLNLTFTVPTAPTITSFTATGETVVPNYVNTTNTNFTGEATITAGEATGGYAEWLIDDVPFLTSIKDESIAAGDTSVTFDAGLDNNAAVQAQIAAGTRVLKVKLCNVAGNCTISTNSIDITADYTAPDAPSITSVAGDGYINDLEKADIRVVGTAEANALVSVTLSDGINSKTGTQQLTGGATAFDITIDGTAATPNPLADGTINSSVTATDVAGNVSSAATPTATKDTAAPAAPTITSIATDNKINDLEKADIRVVGTAEANALVSVTLSDGINSKTGTQQLTGGATAFDITIDGTAATPNPLADGTINSSVTATDVAGNVSSAATPTATKDTVAPTFTIAYYTDESLTTSLTNNYMKAGTYYIKITSNEPLTATPTIDIAAEGSANDIDNGATTSVSGNDYKYTRTITSDDLAIGSVAEVIQITGTDTAGNQAINVNVDGEKYTDTVAPSAPIVNAVATDDVINIAERNAGVTVTGTTEAGTTVTLNGSSATVDGTNWSYVLTSDAIDDFEQGAKTLTAIATDTAGNVNAVNGTKDITVDTVAPTQTVSGVDISVDTGTDGDFITNASAQTITGTLSAELTAGDVLYGSVNNGSTWENITGKVNVTAISWDGVTLSGTSTILFKITDAAGNDSAPTGAQAYTLDTVAPTVGDDYASNGSLVHTNQTITLSASGGNGSLTIKYCFGNNCVPATLYSTPLVFTTNQDTVVRYQASDSAGNLSEIKGFTLKIIKYDINGGGKVDLADFSVMMSVWGKAANYSDNAFKSDLNADNTVNLADFSILMANWGKEN